MNNLKHYAMEKVAYDDDDENEYYDSEIDKARKRRNAGRIAAFTALPMGQVERIARQKGHGTLGQTAGHLSNALLIGGLVTSRQNNLKMRRLQEEQYNALRRSVKRKREE